ncbi:MAG: right-handed parallel beta-helix repeat-containing protein, partial [Thermoguttaceae bacterium]
GTTAKDSSGNGLSATYVGGVQLDQPGAMPFDADTAVTLDGSTGYVQLPTLSNDFTSGFSAEVWAYPTSVGYYQRFFDLGNGSYADNIVLFRNGTSNDLAFTVFQGGSEGNVIVATNAITLDQWQYFAVSMDAKGNVTLYKNGVAIATGTTYVPRAGIVRADNYLGKSNFGGNALYAGSLDEAAIYAAPLSAAPIAAHYAQRIYGTVNIDLLRNGTIAQNIATGVPDNYSYTWTIPTNIQVGDGYAVRVTANNGSDPSGVSGQTFQIASSGTDYYVAVNGSDSNTGTDPSDPMASLSALLTAYPTLGSSDTVHVGPGDYTLVGTVTIGTGHSGLTITGPSSGPPAVFNRNNSGSDVIDVAGAANLTLEDLTVTGGAIGIDILDNSNSTSVTVRNCAVYGNNSYGIYIGAVDNYAQVVGNTVYGLPHDSSSTDNQPIGIICSTSDTGFSGPITVSGNKIHDCTSYGIDFNTAGIGPSILDNEVYACGTGIEIAGDTSGSANMATVSGNTVISNTTGITAGGNVLVSQNVLYGQSGDGISIPDGVYEVVANTVHDNAIGISAYASGGAIANNVVYHNSGDGIEAERNTPVTGNTIYGNATGIALDYYSLGPVSNNLVYENTNQGILVNSGSTPSIINNTVYQPAGDAVDIEINPSFAVGPSNVTLNNNILWTQTGYDIYVDATGEVGFQSDYNDLYTTGSGKLGSWQGQTFLTQQAWYYQIGQDQHSLSVDPQFVDPAGPDGILGFSTDAIGAAQIIDDGSASGFSTTGVWTQVSSSAAENGEYLTTPAGNGSALATWSFTGLTPGATYQVSASWAPTYSFASDAPFTVLDGSQLISLTYQSERTAPSTPGTPAWQTLGYFVPSSGTLTVQLSNASQGTVAADAVMIQQIAGNRGADDDFHVASSSPTIDAGNPSDPVGLEPAPNGGRINLGSDGGTAQATPSQPQVLQVLTPGPLDKLQIGQQENVTWQTGGLYAPANYYSGAVLASGPLAYYRLDDPAGTVATDFSGNGLNASYVGGVQLGQPGALPFDSDTAVILDGSTGYVQLPTLSNDFTSGLSAEVWAYPTSVGSNERFFDLGTGTYIDDISLYRVGTSNDLAFTVFQGYNQGTTVVAHNAITLDQWQYFAVSMDAKGNVTLYKNGAAIATGTTYVPRTGIVRADKYLGRSNSGYALYAGSLDEAAIYAAPLSAAQVAAHYAQRVYGTVNIDLLQNDAVVQNIATGVPDSGSYVWTIPANVLLGAGYQVRVTANNGSNPSGVSGQQFLIANNGHSYYINDSSTVGDVYTSAAGNDANSGKDPADPMATLAALLQAYTLGPADTVYIDTGNYTLLRNVVLDALHSGVTIVGPTSGPGAILNRTNTNPGSYDFQMQGGDNVTLSHLTLTGGLDGLYGSNAANSTGLTVSDSTIFGNVSYGIYLDVGNDHATLADNVVYGDLASNGAKQANGIYLNSGYDTITGNTVYDHSGTGISDSAGTVGGTAIAGNLVYGNATGIYLQANSGYGQLCTVSNNVVRNNTGSGMSVHSNVLVSGNTIYGQSANNAYGIYGDGGVEVANNVIYGNYYGIYTYYGQLNIHNNRLYNNSYAAISTDGSLPVLANVVYSNNIGIQINFNFSGQVDDNLVYANTTDGILIEDNNSGGQYVNNTVYQVSGNAIRLDGGSRSVELRNNILWVLAGYDIYVADDSRTGFNSDYNDLYIGNGSSANVGFWNSAVNNGVQNQLSNWQAATGQDAHSLSANPQFVNITGADDLLGYTQVNGIYADYGEDDNFYLSAGSPAIDRGDSWTAPLTDIQGFTRQDDPGTPNQGSPDYFPAAASPQPAFPSGGTLLSFGTNNFSYAYTLPFSFSFYGQTYTKVYLASDGFLQFAGPDSPADGSNPSAKLLADARIAPLWASLSITQSGDGVWADTSVANQVTFRWAATNTADNSLINFAVTLYSNGSIQFYYGAGNANLVPTVGISASNGITYQLLAGYSGQATLTNAASVLYTLQPGIVDLGAYEFRGSSLDKTPPEIASMSPALVNSGTYFSFTQLQVVFSKPVSSIDADATAVYELREAGSSGFGSVNDVVYSLTPLYNANNNTVTLSINGLGSGTLPPGSYRFTIFSTGTDTIHDLSGNALDGDGDGVAGGNFVRTFTLTGTQPTVTGISPPAGPVVGGTTVTISGANLTGVTAVKFGSNSVPVLSDTGTSITATSPAGALGAVDVTLVAAGGVSSINRPADQFSYVAPPSAMPESYTATQGVTLTVAAPGVLVNDTDPQGYPLTAILVSNPTHGTLSLSSNGSFTYTPNPGYLGADSFTYQASDGYITSSPVTIS